VATNTASGSTNNCSVPPDFGFGPLQSDGYNLTDDATGTACGLTQGTDKVNVNPDFGPQANNGGRTQTLLPGPSSPAVGVIPSPTTLNGVVVCGPGAFDQRGRPRPTRGPNCAIGAVEPTASSVAGTHNVNESGVAPGTVWTLNPGVGELGHQEGTVMDNFGHQGIWSQTRRSVSINIGGCDYFGITHPLQINTRMSPGSYNCGMGPQTWWARLVP
jgi:hypothetical protein